MLSSPEYNNETVTALKQKGVILSDCDAPYSAGVRFYLNARMLAEDGLLLRDGEHIKVRDMIPLEKYMLWYSTAARAGVAETTTPREYFEHANAKFYERFPEFCKNSKDK